MFGIDHEYIKRFYTLIAVTIAVTTVVVRIALYERTIEESTEEIKKLKERVAFLESQSASKSQMDRHQNRQIERIEGVIFLPRKTRFNL